MYRYITSIRMEWKYYHNGISANPLEVPIMLLSNLFPSPSPSPTKGNHYLDFYGTH